MMDLVADIARASAQVLAAELDPRLPLDVERELDLQRPDARQEQYVDPVSCASLIVSVAALAWTIYQDLRRQTAKPSPSVLARRVRVEANHEVTSDVATKVQRDRIISVVVEQIIRTNSVD